MAHQQFQIYLLRHADAGEPEHWTGPEAERPLSDSGRGQARRLASFLAGVGFRPDAIVSSPKARAKETAEIVGGALGTPVATDDRLADEFGVETVAQLLEDRTGGNRLLLVGHDPDFSRVLADLCGTTAAPMRKCALARVDLDGPPGRGSATLRWLIPPDALERPS